MGVFGLWDILLTTAQKINIQQLSGKILAIDASIWLVKADSIFAEDSQKIKLILQKIVFLRKNNILPIFVFDGISPAIKRKTLQKRKQKLRQGSEIDIRKKTQIEVMHILQNYGKQKTSKQSSKQKKIIQKQEQMDQINKLLTNLSQVQIQKSQNVTDEDIIKIRLQSQVLTYKYQLMMEDTRLQGLQKMTLQDFQQLELSDKLEYLRLVENELYSKQSRKNNLQTLKQLSKLSHQQQIIYDMHKIQKKAKLRQLQDELYRKTIKQNVKIQDGFQIIEEVRNGKKIVMKRKINEAKDKNSWLGRGVKKQKNDFSAIFNYKQVNNQTQKDEYETFGNEPDPFLMDLFGKDLKKANQDSNSKSKTISVNPNVKVKNWKLQQDKTEQQRQKQNQKKLIRQKKQIKERQRKMKQLKNEQKNKSNMIKNKNDNLESDKQIQGRINENNFQNDSSQLDEFLQNSLLGQRLRKIQQNKINENQNQDIQNQQYKLGSQLNATNPDNLPSFINYQNLTIRHLDSDNHRNLQFQKLLQMLGIPFIKAVSEAEAQCAKLEIQGMVDGIVTQDSDIFLFGARNVFRGVFNDNIKYFNSHRILQKLKLNRQKLIIFAMLLGSDYTDGIKGVGIVNAMQILKIFDDFDKLQKFKKWARYADILHTNQKNTTQNIIKKLSDEEQKQFYEFHKRFKNYWYIDDDFPKLSVIQAYLNPDVIDNARIKEMKQIKYFELKEFNQEVVRVFMKDRLLLTYSQTQTYCHYLKRLFKRQQQKKMTDFFAGQDHEFAKIRSKRLMKALGQKPQDDEQKEKKEKKNN